MRNPKRMTFFSKIAKNDNFDLEAQNGRITPPNSTSRSTFDSSKVVKIYVFIMKIKSFSHH